METTLTVSNPVSLPFLSITHCTGPLASKMVMSSSLDSLTSSSSAIKFLPRVSKAETVIPTLPNFCFCKRARERAISIATFPPPIMTADLGTSNSSPFGIILSKSTAFLTFLFSLPGIRVERPFCKPIAKTTASLSFCNCCIVISLPIRTLY